jgi:hypothetical protein
MIPTGTLDVPVIVARNAALAAQEGGATIARTYVAHAACPPIGPIGTTGWLLTA